MKLSHATALAVFVCLPLVAQEPPDSSQASPAVPAKRPNIPDHFINLTVLPRAITKPELVGIMKQFAVTMKVRCSYCHTISGDLSEGSFASGEKPLREEARKLMRLIQQAAPAPTQP
jgi:hypothetical protein